MESKPTTCNTINVYLHFGIWLAKVEIWDQLVNKFVSGQFDLTEALIDISSISRNDVRHWNICERI